MKFFLNRHRRPSLFLRFIAFVVLPVQLITSNQVVYAETTSGIQSLTNPPEPKPHIGYTAQVVEPTPVTQTMKQPPQKLSYVASEICAYHLFHEELLPTSNKTNQSEDLALLTALRKYAANPTRLGLAALEQFVKQYPNSVWNGSIYADLGFFYRERGYYSRAVSAWETAWALTKSSSNPYIHNLADRVVGELLTLLTSLGRLERTEPLLAEIQNRPVSGAAKALVRGAHEGHWLMKNQPGSSFKCGPFALKSICQELKLTSSLKPLDDAQSTPKGFSLDFVESLATQVGLHFTPVAAANQPIPTPAVVHWKSGHYAAILKSVKMGYVVKDPTFGPYDVVLSPDAIADESDAFLIPSSSVNTSWTVLTLDQQKLIYGRGAAPSGPTGDTCPNNPKCNCPNSSHGMMTYNIFAAVLSLTLSDTPVGYNPPIGPSIPFTVNLTQYEASQPANFTYFNQGPLAVQNWTASVTGTFGTTITVNVPGGGQKIYTSPTTLSGDPTYQGYYGPELESQTYLWVTKSGAFERRFPDGSKEIYSQPNGNNTYFLTAIIDPQGNAVTLQYTTLSTSDQFNGDLQLTSVTDAIGQQTTYTYGLTSDPLKITRVTDPFGRQASFGYSGNPLVLTSTTDVINITSAVTYDTNGMIAALNTPYGTTSFFQDTSITPSNEQVRTVQITNPLGQQEFMMRRLDGLGYPNSEPTAPSSAYNLSLGYRNTFIWDRHAIDVMKGQLPSLASYHEPGSTDNSDLTYYFLNDFSNAGGLAPTASYATIDHWLHNSDLTMSGVLDSVKFPLESRLWYTYPGQSQAPYVVGTSNLPATISRILANGDTQTTQFSYNQVGKITQTIDPMGRTTNYSYDPTGIDLLSASQKDGSGTDVLFTYTYTNGTHTVSNHKPLTVTNASGQVTVFIYNSQGQPTSITNPKGETTLLAYSGSSGSGSGNYLHTITGPAPPQGSPPVTILQYDSVGRANYAQSPQGYVVTAVYDSFDRPTTVAFPDGTTNLYNYAFLDLASATDRLNHTVSYNYDSLREVISEIDPNGAQTTCTWCTCGGMGSLRDPNGHITNWQRDLEGRVTGKIYPDGGSLSWKYEATSNRVTFSTDSNQSVTAYTYNDDNGLAQITFSAGPNVAATPSQSYTYDPVYPRVATFTDGLGTTTYHYNPFVGGTTLGQGQLGSTTFSPSGTSYTLSPTIQTSYDQLGRTLSTNIGASGANTDTVNNYDDLGRVTSLTNPLGIFNLGYYSNTPRINSIAMPNGVTTTLSYLDQGNTTQDPRLGDITNSDTNGVISKFDYQYDSEGRITDWTQQADANTPTNWTYGYDPTGQLTSAIHSGIPNPVQYSYAYDLAGNRTSAQMVSATNTSITATGYDRGNKAGAQTPGGSLLWSGTSSTPLYSVTLNNQPGAIDNTGTNFSANVPVTSGTNSVQIVAEDQHANYSTNNYTVTNVGGNNSSTPSYDANGNTVTDAIGNNCQYDARNNLVLISYKAGGSSQFTYDGFNRRVMIVDTSTTGTVTSKQFIFSGSAIAEEYDGTNTTQPSKRFYGQGFIQYSGTNNSTASPYCYTRDHLGSVRELTNSSGNVVTRLDYDPYGVTSVISGTVIPDFAFAGMYQHQASGLYLANYRFYNPSLARWITKDPIQEAGGLNLYAYCGNDPVNATDPMGMSWGATSPTASFEGTVAFGALAILTGGALALLSPALGVALGVAALAGLAIGLGDAIAGYLDGAAYTPEQKADAWANALTGALGLGLGGLASEGSEAAGGVGSMADGIAAAVKSCGGKSCFPPDTLILMADGSKKAIQDIKVGDSVLTQDDGKQTSHKVTQIDMNWTQSLIHISIQGSSDNDNELLATGDHQISTTSRGWVHARDLIVGDQLLDSQGNHHLILKIRSIPRLSVTFNLSVQGSKTFFALAGKIPLLVRSAAESQNISDSEEESPGVKLNWFRNNDSFPGGTMVATPNGQTPIEDLRVGQEIYAFDFNSNTAVTDKIEKTYEHLTSQCLVLKLDYETIRVTGSHPFWVQDRHMWFTASDLLPGMKVRLLSGQTENVVSTTTEDIKKPQTFYNLEVNRDHTYFVGQGQILVHNGNGSYTLTFSNGMTYAGKGDQQRAADSAKRIIAQQAAKVPSVKITLTNTDWSDASSTDDSFIQEEYRMRATGAPGGNTYNQINQPGQSILGRLFGPMCNP